MKFEFRNYLRAGYPALVIPTPEEQRAIEALRKQAPEYSCYTWDMVRGVEEIGKKNRQEIESPVEALNRYPLLRVNRTT